VRTPAHRKLLIWTRIPTHHQAAFFTALRNARFDLVVHYYTQVGQARRSLGWSVPDRLPHGERYVSQHLNAVGECPDWHERIHIVPGYGAPFLLQLATWLSLREQKWLHWSEPSQYSYRSYLTYPAKRYYGALVDRYSLGALAIGDLAHQDFLRWGISDTKIRFLPYAVAGIESASLTDSNPETDTPRFLFLGQLCRRKGIDILLRAFRLVLDEYPRAQLELVGHDASRGKYARLAEALHLGSGARFLNSVPAAQIGAAVARNQILVLPSRHDGWGMVLNEGASAGKALIASEACGSAHHLIVPNRNGFRVATGDVRSLADAMLMYARHPELIQAHGDESRKIFSDYTPEQNVHRLSLALDSLAVTSAP
jgi:glycosyltransferase involved in cell wall biosynthesis